jgi:hypothetical protein
MAQVKSAEGCQVAEHLRSWIQTPASPKIPLPPRHKNKDTSSSSPTPSIQPLLFYSPSVFTIWTAPGNLKEVECDGIVSLTGLFHSAQCSQGSWLL